MTRAVFLDRDGVINQEVDLLIKIRDLRILSGTAQAIKKLNHAGFLLIVATNQPQIARGWITEEGVERINKALVQKLKKEGAKIDAVYYCPHHPNANLKKYRKNCICRKPNIGLIKKAQKRFRINLRKSFFVGDTTRDILAGKRAKMKTILVKTGYAGKDGKYKVKPDYKAKDLREAVKVILKK